MYVMQMMYIKSFIDVNVFEFLFLQLVTSGVSHYSHSSVAQMVYRDISFNIHWKFFYVS